MIKLLSIAGIVALFGFTCSLEAQPRFDPFFDEADAFLSKHIEDGKVPYETIKQKPKQLNNLVEMIGNISLDEASSPEKKAFYINAYNILTIHSIIENGIPASPMDVEGFFDTIIHNVASKMLTLNELEKDTLFFEFGDARMHFAIVCAALGCPQIQSFAYQPKKLDTQLDHVTTETLNRDYFIRVKPNEKKVEVSMIFNWYKQDFLDAADSILSYINRYRKDKIPGDFGVDFL